MRPIFAIVVALVILGGLRTYMASRPKPTRYESPAVVQAEGRFDLELTLSFDAVPDPFAFDSTEAASVLVLFKGNEILRKTQEISAGEPFVVQDIQGVEVGQNEFFVEVNPQDPSSLLSRALRIRILRDGQPIGDESLWSSPGAPVAGTVNVVAAGFKEPESHDHGGEKSGGNNE